MKFRVLLFIMRKINASTKLVLLTLFFAFPLQLLAQSDQIDGDQLIKDLMEQRYRYNMSIINGAEIDVPSVNSLIEQPNCSITFAGNVFLIKNNCIIAVKGFDLSAAAIEKINARFVLLDKIQKMCCEKSGLACSAKKRSLNEMKALDRQYFATLKSLKYFFSFLSDKIKSPKASELILASKLNLPRSLLAQVQ